MAAAVLSGVTPCVCVRVCVCLNWVDFVKINKCHSQIVPKETATSV